MMEATKSPSERPRERIYGWALYRVHILKDYARRNCMSATCGQRDEGGDPLPCAGKDCGEKRMAEEHQRELQAMRDVCSLVEWLERQELERAAKDDKTNRRSR
jgi:hypothetical protein